MVSVSVRHLFFTARRYAMLTLCPSTRSSITNRYYIETTERLNESSWFWHRSFLRPIILCVIRKFGYLQDYWYFLLELCSKLLENFATGSRSCCQKNSSTVELVDDTCDSRRVVAARTWFITRRSTVTL